MLDSRIAFGRSVVVAAMFVLSACNGSLGGGERLADSGAHAADAFQFDAPLNDAGVIVDATVADGAVVDLSVPVDAGGMDASTPIDFGLPPDSGVVIPLDGSVDFSVPTLGSYPGSRRNVNVFATADNAAPSITLRFVPVTGVSVSAIQIWRKSRDATTWGAVYATPAASDDRFNDTAVARGDYFEYKIHMTTSAGDAYGYVSAGVETPAREYNGKIILVVDSDYETALAAPITQLIADYEGDGWNVIRQSAMPWWTPAMLHANIQAAYDADPANVKAVFLLGHVPVAYSGRLNPDGHGDHLGAWPADGYYGDMNGSWTDSSINMGNNVAGDGRWDQNDYPSTIELQVGRIDMWYMDSFWEPGETDDRGVLARYLDRVHRYKMHELVPTVRAMIYDNFDHAADMPGYGFAQSAYAAMIPTVGPWNITHYANQSEATGYVPYFTRIDGQSHLWTFACGGGSAVSASGIGTTWELAGVSTGGFFNMTIGSFFGDWNSDHNNFLKAFVAGGNGIASMWAGRPHWMMHSMAMGETIGYGTRATMNNAINGTYDLVGDDAGPNVHLALFGDPTLRIGMPAPASGFAVSNVGGKAHFAWTASPEAVNGYYVYQINASSITRVTSTPVVGTSFTSTDDYVAGRRYSVRALRLQSNLSGNHYDLSVGRVATAP